MAISHRLGWWWITFALQVQVILLTSQTQHRSPDSGSFVILCSKYTLSPKNITISNTILVNRKYKAIQEITCKEIY